MRERGLEIRRSRGLEVQEPGPHNLTSPLTPHLSHLTSHGILYIVATPIGNLEDITLRALRVLKDVDYILCEDKRITTRLLNKYQIKKKLISFHKFNEIKELAYIMSLLASCKKIALVSDAGTPLISDPGLTLISTLQNKNVQIVPVPGASALTTALSLCPFDCKEVLFLGFLPKDKSKRKKIIYSLKKKSVCVVLFVPPHDFKKYLNEIYDTYPNVEVFYAKELTKIHEEYWSGKIKDLINRIETWEGKSLRGEFVLLLYFNSDSEETKEVTLSKGVIIEKIRNYIQKGFSLKEASKILSDELNVSRKHLYDLYVK